MAFSKISKAPVPLFILVSLILFQCSSDDNGVVNNGNGNEPAYDSLITYVSSDGISVIKPNGTLKQTIVTDDPDSLFSPIWSPGKIQIVFVRIIPVMDGDLIKSVDYPGGAESDIAVGTISSNPWSPNGELVTYTRNDSVFINDLGTGIAQSRNVIFATER